MATRARRTSGDTVVREGVPSPPTRAFATTSPVQPRRPARAQLPDAGRNLAARFGQFGGLLVRQVRWLVDWSEPYRRAAQPAVSGVRGILATVSWLGWVLLSGAIVSVFLGNLMGWREFSYLGATLFALFAVACFFAIGRTKLGVTLELSPPRVVVGDSAAAQVIIVNEAKAPVMPLGLDFPVGSEAARFALPLLAPGASFEDMVVIPTVRRGVIEVGPVRTQRGDPFGVLRREVAWTDRYELFVHPLTVPLEPLGAGLLRDLEGRTTQDISMSDLAFHTLREYAPGDDRRYIHWRSSAKLSGAEGADRFLVRQFLDTRRSHVAVVTDVSADSYRTPEEFELAVSVGASITVRALHDQMDLTIVCGENAAVQPPPHLALDTFSRASFEDWTLAAATARLNRLSPDASVVLLITGPRCEFGEFLRARSFLPREAAMAVIQVDEDAGAALRAVAGVPVVSIGDLRELSRVMAGGQLA